MVRQYKIHTNLDGNDDKVWDVTNGKVRLYQPSNLGIDVMNNLWSGDGIGIMGTRNISQPDITFTLLTLGSNLEENYRLMNEFVNDLLSVRYVTLEYQTELFQVFADIALSSVTKTEGYGHNGTFTEEITFKVVTKWYTYESLEFTQIENGEIIQGVSKIYGGQAGSSVGYRYIENVAYTYYGETDVQRLGRWEIDKPFFSFTAKLVPSDNIDNTNLIGLKFLNTNLNEYSAILFKEENKSDYIMINTDVNDEFYLATKDGVTSNAFPQLDMQRYRTRIFSEGQMQMQNLASVDIKVKRKADFM